MDGNIWRMLFSERYKTMVNKVTFVDFREAIAPIAHPGSAPVLTYSFTYVVPTFYCLI